MAIVSVVHESGEQALYDIPDSELEKYRLKSAPMSEETRARLFPGKDKLTKEDAHGFIQVASQVPHSE
jgi:hypothetical protein